MELAHQGFNRLDQPTGAAGPLLRFAVLSVDEGEVVLLELVEEVASKLWLATILSRARS
jgi:hypothetical protein